MLDTQANGAVPFWFWNGDQQESKVTRQLEWAAENGLRGMAIQARRGNRTEYMSKPWIDLVRHSCEEAIRLGLEIWLHVVTLRLNGRDLGQRYAAPYRFNVDDAWCEGPNEIVLTLLNTAQNLFGPHRHRGCRSHRPRRGARAVAITISAPLASLGR